MNNYLTPYVLEKGSMNMHSVDIFSRLLQDRILFIGDEIDDDLANLIVAQLLYLDNINHNPITIYINSPGGNILSGLAIYDTMNLIKSPVYTLSLGLAASMAAIILMAGEKEHRCSLPNASILIHQALGGTRYAQCSDVQIAAKNLQNAKEKLINIIVKCTGQSYDKVSQDCDRDYWMTPKKALSYNIIDYIQE